MDRNVSLGLVFGAMESAKKQFNVEDYAIHPATLEQVFLAFTRNQVAMYTVETLPQTGISVIRKDINGSPIVYI
jgi:hypothetical protein